MRKLSVWAKNNPWTSRVIIAISHVLILINAIFLGIQLSVFGWGVPHWLLLIIANFFFVLYVFYPKKGAKNTFWNYSYTRQKMHDFGLIIFYIAIIALGVSNLCTEQVHHHNIAPPSASAVFMVLTPKVDSGLTEHNGWYTTAKEKIRSSKKELRRELRALKKELRRSNNAGEGEGLKILLILLTVLGALLLATVVAALACSISCSGNETLGGVVVIVGLVAIIWLSVIVIKKILEKEPSRERKFY